MKKNKEAINNFASYLHCAMTSHLHKAQGLSHYYRNGPMFSDRYAWANSADPDQTKVYTVCHSVCIIWTHYCMIVE